LAAHMLMKEVTRHWGPPFSIQKSTSRRAVCSKGNDVSIALRAGWQPETVPPNSFSRLLTNVRARKKNFRMLFGINAPWIQEIDGTTRKDWLPA
jgi:hypothetical protein